MPPYRVRLTPYRFFILALRQPWLWVILFLAVTIVAHFQFMHLTRRQKECRQEPRLTPLDNYQHL